jgi:3-dehydroquinate synthase
MTKFTINGSAAISEIMVGESLKNFREYLSGGQTIIITDENVNKIYGHFWSDFPTIIIGTGEKIKTLATVNKIYSQLMKLQADRSAFIVGIGGGIVCDIAGFVASTYLRGIQFGFVPTTLLAQVDASVGGKNGVNFKGFKNIIGTFNQPGFVICDPEVLHSLPEIELSNGFAEIVKHTLIADDTMFSYLENNYENALNLDYEVISKLVAHSIRIKSGIVNRDEKESGERRLLNFGHTFGHAIEKISGISHGQAVSLGMIIAARFSHNLGYLSFEANERIKNLLLHLKLPVKGDFNHEKLIKAILKDKKRTAERIAFILLTKIGEAKVAEIPIADLKEMLTQTSD